MKLKGLVIDLRNSLPVLFGFIRIMSKMKQFLVILYLIMEKVVLIPIFNFT